MQNNNQLSEFQDKIKNMERNFLLKSTTPSLHTTAHGLPKHYTIALTEINDENYGKAAKGAITTFYGDTLVESEGIFNHASSKEMLSLPHKNSGANYYITTVNQNGEFEHTYLYSAGEFKDCTIINLLTGEVSTVSEFKNLPTQLKMIISNHNKLALDGWHHAFNGRLYGSEISDQFVDKTKPVIYCDDEYTYGPD